MKGLEMMHEAGRLMEEVSRNIAEVSQWICMNEDDRSRTLGVKRESSALAEGSARLRDLMTGISDWMVEDWDSIARNRVLAEITRAFIMSCMRFDSLCNSFDEMVVGCSDDRLPEDWDPWAARRYVVVMYNFMNSIQPALGHIGISLDDEPAYDDPYRGCSARFRKFFTGLGDDAIKNLVKDKAVPSRKGTWSGKRCEAVIFKECFNLTDSIMNSAFHFPTKKGADRPLHSASDAPKLDFPCYDIWGAIESFKVKIGTPEKRLKNFN